MIVSFLLQQITLVTNERSLIKADRKLSVLRSDAVDLLQTPILKEVGVKVASGNPFTAGDPESGWG